MIAPARRARAAHGHHYEVPALLGGDLAKAEELFRKGTELDARYTMLRVGLGKTLTDWTMKDAPDAKRLLAEINKGS